MTWSQTGYGYQTVALAAQEEPSYPCEYCGGQGFTGVNLTVPCRPCGTTGERTAPRRERPAPRLSAEELTRYADPWAVPTVPDTDPPF